MTDTLRPPSWDASTPEERWDYVVQAIASLHAALDVIRRDLAKLAHDVAAQRQVDVEAEAATRGLADRTASRMAELGADVSDVGHEIESIINGTVEVLDDEPAPLAEAVS